MDATPPRDLDTERSYLGSCLMAENVDRQREMLDLVTPADLWSEHHREVYGLMRRMSARGLVDLPGMFAEAMQSSMLDRLGGPEVLTTLGDHAIHSALLQSYATRLRDLGRRRAVIEHGLRLATLAADVAVDLARVEAVAVEAPKASSPRGPWAKIGPLARPLTTAPEPPRWLLWQGAASKSAGLMRAGRVGLLSAPGGSGKTLALCSLALAVVTGRPWLSEAPTMPHRGGGYAVDPAAVGGRVALLLGEEDEAEVHRRLWQVARLMGLSTEELAAAQERLVVGPLAGEDVTLVDADGAPMVDGLARTLAEQAGPGFALVILDPLSRFGGLEAEVDNGLATRTVGALERLTALPGKPSVLVAHHERKGGGKGTDAVRGASALVDGARWVARLCPVELGGRRWRSGAGHRAVWLRLVKTNYTPPLEAPRLVMLDSGHGGAPRVARAGELDELRDALASGPPTADERADFAEVPELAGALEGAPKAGAKRAASKASSKGGPAPIGVEL